MNDAAPSEQAGHSAGVIRFFDNTYTQVGSDFGGAGNLRGPDIHELNTPGHDGYTFLQDIFEIKKMDLEPYRGPKDGYVLDACFQEIDMRTKGVLFQWCALDHMPIWDTYMYLHGNQLNDSMPIAGNGTWDAPWDYFHINAVGKNMENDYIISGRHLNAVFKVAGNNNNLGRAPGDILWTLGGKRNSFEMLDNFNFSRQHTVRFRSTGKTETQISLFNNAYDGWFYTADYSEGQLISINNATNQARLIASYPSPEGERSFSQGSMQVLDNGNVFMGWGNRPYFSEHTSEGKPLYHAHYSGDVESFRIWKHPWKGYPKTQPKLVSYALAAGTRLFAYVSWNGATEVKAWAVYYSTSTRHGPWHKAGVLPKKGFETFVNITELEQSATNVTFKPFVYAEALDVEGRVMAKTNVYETYVPNKDYKKMCDETLCYKKRWETYDRVDSEADKIGTLDYTPGLYAAMFFLFTLELVSLAMGYAGWDWLFYRFDSRYYGQGMGMKRQRLRGSWDEKFHGRPGVNRLVSGPAPTIVSLNGRKGTGFTTKVSGFEV